MGFYSKQKKVKQYHGAQRKDPEVCWDLFEPTVIPDGFVLLVDTREQIPLFASGGQFKNDEIRVENGLVMKGKTLHLGDYSIGGYHKAVGIERKKQSDWESFILSEYKRKTIPKLCRMRDAVWSALVIEANLGVLYNYPVSPKMTREKVRNQLASIETHYGIHTYITGNRKELEMWVLDRLVRVYKYLQEGTLHEKDRDEKIAEDDD